ncbi:hypothetical protein GCM10027430_11800 [Lysobacter tyrosinilyticus]
MRIALQFAALAAIEVGIEHEAPRIVRLEQHDSRRRSCVSRRRGYGHGGAIGFAGRRGLGEEAIEGGKGFGIERGRRHAYIVAAMPDAVIRPPRGDLRPVATSHAIP